MERGECCGVLGRCVVVWLEKNLMSQSALGFKNLQCQLALGERNSNGQSALCEKNLEGARIAD